MRPVALFGFIILLAGHISLPVQAQTTDDSLRIYAVNIVKTLPFRHQFTGYGIYLGKGIIITAAHVVGNWPLFTRPRVRIAGQDLPAKVIKEGSFQQIDLALLSVEETELPLSLRLRRNPLCNKAADVGIQVVDVIPEKTARSRIISPLLIAPKLRTRFGTLINSQQISGSGIFDAERKCLVGIVSAKIPKNKYQLKSGRLIGMADGFAGYFVPAAEIANFIPQELHF
jgi:hypothetical protein